MNYYEILLIIAIIILQFIVFVYVWKKTILFKRFFPNIDDINLPKFKLPENIIFDREKLNDFISSPRNIDTENSDTYIEPEVLTISENNSKKHILFSKVLKSTNAYLVKTKNYSSDFTILQDTCERQLQKIDNEISNLINVPLYLGLGGTFIGIIIGLFGIEFTDVQSQTNVQDVIQSVSTESIDKLLKGVITAMFASLFGLTFTVINTAINYKIAVNKNDNDKNDYFDFLQREILPVINMGMANSINSFKNVLDHFIKRFGANMESYSDSAQLLNENLTKQQFVLEEINKLNLTQTSTEIVKIFAELKESSEHLETFKEYQKSLNENIVKTENMVSNFNQTIEHFNNFNDNLSVISTTTIETLELQKQFKESLEKHFPTIQDHRVLWRTQIDELNNDIKESYQELNNYFNVANDYIKEFIESNHNFFEYINKIQESIDLNISTSDLENTYFENLKDEINHLNDTIKESSLNSINLNQDVINAIKDFNIKLAKIEIISHEKQSIPESTNNLKIENSNGKKKR